jgi:hypothetical protein
MGGKAFVVMPFRDETDDLWRLGIRDTLRAKGWQCERADDLASPGAVMDQVYAGIAGADIVIGEITEPNQNVFYEIGFALIFRHTWKIPPVSR